MLGNHNTGRATIALIDAPRIATLSGSFADVAKEAIAGRYARQWIEFYEEYVGTFFSDEKSKLDPDGARLGGRRFIGFWCKKYGFWKYDTSLSSPNPHTFYIENGREQLILNLHSSGASELSVDKLAIWVG